MLTGYKKESEDGLDPPTRKSSSHLTQNDPDGVYKYTETLERSSSTTS